MTNAIQKFQFEAPKSFGSNEELSAIIERMKALIPVEVNADDLVKAKNLDNSYLKAAQLAVFYRLIPSIDIHIIPFGSNFSVDIGVAGWQKAADRFCSLHRITYHAHYEAMTEQELKARRGQDYTPEDVGAICYLWRSDKASAYAIFGGDNPKEALTKGYGSWAKKARFDKYKKEWYPDSIPVQRTKEDVARRRSLKAALKAEFSLDSLLAAAPNEITEALTYLDSDAKSAMRVSAITQRPEVVLDDDGFVVTPSTIPKRDPNQEEEEPDDYDYDGGVIVGEANFLDNDPGEPEEDEEEGDYPEEEDEGEDFEDIEIVKEYRVVAETLTGSAATLRDWSRKQHQESQGAAYMIAYRILVGEVEKLIGKDNHHFLFGVLLGRHVSSKNTPGEKFVRFLLAFLQEEIDVIGPDSQPVKDEKGKKLKSPNPSYNVKTVEAIKETWRQANPQPSLAAALPSKEKPSEPEGLQAEIPF